MDSLWHATAQKSRFPTLEGDIKTDIVIVGGGLAGLMCLKELTDRGADCILLEAKTIGSGVTGNTTAKITFQHGLVYDRLINKYGTEKAHLYLDANKKALEKMKRMSQIYPCDLEEKEAFVYSSDDRKKIEKEIRAYERLGVKAQFCEAVPLPVSCIGAVKIPSQAQFHPLKFMYTVSENLRICENSKVTEFLPGKVKCEKGTVTARIIIIATHFPVINKHGAFPLKLYQHRSYVIALDNAPDINGMYLDEKQNGFSFRNYKDLLLIGGGDHRTGKSGGSYNVLYDFCRQNYPDSAVKYSFAAQDCMSLDNMPYIGRYSGSSRDIYVATGFNKWGMTSSIAAADILADMVTGRKNPYAGLFAPDRSVLHPQLFANIFHSFTGIITPTVPRCPHMGCALKYNKDEHSWDCPCHGSRFSEKGELIDNPATDDMK